MRYPLVDGQGNFGSIDGDPPAAMRYTEARLEALAEAMMADLDKETVDFVPNYDETTEEPTVLPTTFPNLLVNGSAGIAVGMATNIPPHNLREVIDGCHRRRSSSAASRATRGCKAVLQVVPGPDFPTGGFIVGRDGIYQAYTTGRGSITRARQGDDRGEQEGRQASSIVITEIPYQVNKARLIEKIAELVREKMIEGISDLRDESDRDGMRIVIELKRGEVPEVVLNNLYKHTQLQTTFGIIMLAIVGGRPKVLHAARDHRALHRVPPRSRPAPHRVRAAQGRGPRAHPRRPQDRARSPRRGDQADPRLEEPGRSARRPDDAVRAVAAPGAGDPRHAAAAADRPRAPEDPRRARSS